MPASPSRAAEILRSVSEPLLRGAIASDHAPLLGLLEAARPDIRRYARATCHASNIDDAMQETLWLRYRRVGTLRAVSSFSVWLFAIVRRDCLRLDRGFTDQFGHEVPIANKTET